MAIITYLGSTVDEYRREAVNIIKGLTLCCPRCPLPSRKMVIHDNYKRGIKDLGEEIQVNRVICHDCGKTQAVLPDFLQPRKQFSAATMENALMNEPDEGNMGASGSTKSRWRNTLSQKVLAWASLMCVLALETTGRTVSTIILTSLSPLEQICELAKCLPRVNCSSILGLASMFFGEGVNRY